MTGYGKQNLAKDLCLMCPPTWIECIASPFVSLLQHKCNLYLNYCISMLHDQRSCVYTKYLLEPKYLFKFGRTTGGKKSRKILENEIKTENAD